MYVAAAPCRCVLDGAPQRSLHIGAQLIEYQNGRLLSPYFNAGLRLPAEGPCECDLFFTCSRFVTTPAHARRLRERHQLKLTLVEDARSRDWAREAERHRCIAERIKSLLADMGLQVTDET